MCFSANTVDKDYLIPEEVLTEHERYLKSIGMTKSDEEEDHIALGAVGVFMWILAIGLIIAVDIPSIRREVRQRMIRNIKSGVQH